MERGQMGMNIKAIFIDIDGTLLNSRFMIDELTRNTLLDFQKHGGVLVLCSARPYQGMIRYGKELELARYHGYYAAFNGGEIIDANSEKTIYNCSMAKEDLQAVYDITRSLEQAAQKSELAALINKYSNSVQLTIDLMQQIHGIIDKTNLNLMTYQKDKLLCMRQEVYAVAEMLVNGLGISICQDFITDIDFDPVKVLISGDPSLISAVYPEIQKSLCQQCDVLVSDPFLIEVTAKGVNKGRALSSLCLQLGIDLKDTAAFGDSANDIPMLKEAGFGVAMGNANEEVKQSSKFITSSNDESGIAKFLLKNKVI
ncbi:Cof-type HAD-IIB family hydrolase [Dielma fastidiosa]|uniref:Cof-type HAD-IIB family hydrolase n=1 Tax=Dielma fastidiosa TaxID=1034346 RepID=UPI0015F82B24|nr:Cof-type HAD-IIB family hydrolase [Dielma fastidiosa]